MSSFSIHPILSSLKPKVTALLHDEDRLYVGFANGSLHVYSFSVTGGSDSSSGSSRPSPKLIRTQSTGKRAIEQIGILQETKQLVILSDSNISLYPSADNAKASPTALSQARNPHAFAISSYSAKNPVKKTDQKDLETRSGSLSANGDWVTRSLLVVGCRKKVVVYGAGKGGFLEAWELSLPHSPRQVIFPSPPSGSSNTPIPETVYLLYSPSVSVLLNIQPLSVQRLSISELPDLPIPPPASHRGAGDTTGPSTGTSGSAESIAGGMSLGMGGMSALSGLGGYVGLGKGASMPVGTRTVGGEVLIAREELGVFYSSEGNPTRSQSLAWPSPPEAIAFSSPYIYAAVSIMPAGPSSTGKNPANVTVIPGSAIQINLGPTLALRQIIALPPPSTGSTSVHSIRPIVQNGVSSVHASLQVLFVSTPTDKTLAISEGSTISAVEASEIGSQVDQLVLEGRVLDAIGLVEAVGDSDLAPSRRLPHLKTILAVRQFAEGHYQAAIDTFLAFNVNPALVLSLFPAKTISGSLHVPRKEWLKLFGAVDGARFSPEQPSSASFNDTAAGVSSVGKGLLRGMAHLALAKKASSETLRTTDSGNQGDEIVAVAPEEDGTAEKPAPIMDGEEEMAPRAALEALMYFLSDRRQKFTGAITTRSNPLPSESDFPPLSAVPAADLHSLPSIPMTDYGPEQLLRMAQIIYTGLLKVYLVARPILVGSLCRIENWCDVDEVEELLKAQKKFGDLIDLYQGKKMHSKALKMLRQLAAEEGDRLDKYPPTIRYLQKLGPTELPLILESARWVFGEDPTMALQIFTADEPEVETLPRQDVMQYLERLDTASCIGFLEHVIDDLGDETADLHDKLAELYLGKAREADQTAEGDQTPEYERLLKFLSSSTSYRPYRLLSRLSREEMPEARAILLGRMGNHEEALQIYVYRLEDYSAAEIYCAKVYTKDPDPHGIFLLLLRLYLRPVSSEAIRDKPIKLSPALALIAKHGVRLDAEKVLELLPPLVTMADVKAFFIRTLRDNYSKGNEHRVVRSLLSARKEEVERGLMGLQSRRVKITDQRICPQCNKRLGQSAIAVHVPRGEVTHLHCKDQFSERLLKRSS